MSGAVTEPEQHQHGCCRRELRRGDGQRSRTDGGSEGGPDGRRGGAAMMPTSHRSVSAQPQYSPHSVLSLSTAQLPTASAQRLSPPIHRSPHPAPAHPLCVCLCLRAVLAMSQPDLAAPIRRLAELDLSDTKGDAAHYDDDNTTYHHQLYTGPVVDPHVHFFDFEHLSYPWLKGPQQVTGRQRACVLMAAAAAAAARLTLRVLSGPRSDHRASFPRDEDRPAAKEELRAGQLRAGRRQRSAALSPPQHSACRSAVTVPALCRRTWRRMRPSTTWSSGSTCRRRARTPSRRPSTSRSEAQRQTAAARPCSRSPPLTLPPSPCARPRPPAVGGRCSSLRGRHLFLR